MYLPSNTAILCTVNVKFWGCNSEGDMLASLWMVPERYIDSKNMVNTKVDDYIRILIQYVHIFIFNIIIDDIDVYVLCW